MKKFEDFNFNVISVSGIGATEMQINKRYITFTKNLLGAMSYPAYVRILIDVDNQVFALQACKETDENAYKFSKPRGEQKDAKYVMRIAVRKPIMEIMGEKWSAQNSYAVKGTYLKEANAMVFDLATAVIRTSSKPQPNK